MKLLCALLLAASVNAVASDFEGTVTFNVSNPKNRISQISYSLKGDKARVEMATPKNGSIAVIVDNAAKTSTLLIEFQKKYVISTLREPKEPAASARLSKTGATATIAGYACDEYTADGPDGQAHIWATQGLGSFRHFKGGPMSGRMRAPAWEKALMDQGLFPLKLVENGSTMEAQSVKAESLPDSLFEAPSDYEKVDRRERAAPKKK